MHLFKKVIVLFAVLLTSSAAFSQKMSVQGTVYDSTGNITLKNAMVMAVRMSDSLLLDFTRTDAAGKFSIGGFEADTFALTVEYPGHDEKIYYIFGHKDNYEITIPAVVLPSRSQELEEVVIYAYKDPIYYKGDTLVYVADSFNVAEGAVVEDLLKKLPGITVDKEGKITSQGREISQVLVDGDEFFGTDPTIATKNLGAEGIAEVQVYEKENDEGIGGNDEKIQVLDLRLKEDAKKGYFGRAAAASDFALMPKDGEIGTNPFYEGELLFNKFKGSQKISVFALGSNTPRSSFGWGDMNKFGLENESGTGNRWDPNSQGTSSGIPQTLKAGVYFSDKLGEKKRTKIGFNYSYYNDRLEATSASESQYFLTDTTYYTDDSTRNYTSNESHRINLDLETQIDSLTTIQIKPSITIDRGTTENSEISNFFDTQRDQTLGTAIFNNNESQGYTLGGFARITRQFKKPKREMELRYDISANDNQTDGYLESTTQFFSAVIPNDTTLQLKGNDNSTTNHYGTLTYIEPLSKKLKLEMEYLYQFGTGTQDRSTFDFDPLTGQYSSFNTFFSNIFDSKRQQNRGGARLIFNTPKHELSGGARFRNITIDNVNLITDTTIYQSINNLLPRVSYQFKPSMSKRLRFNYETSSSAPSINDLAPVPDNTNPNRLREGNPDLLPNYVHSLNVFYNSWNALSGKFVWAGFNVSLTQDAFSTESYFDAFGRTISKTINVDGNTSAFFFSGAGFPFFGRKLEVRPELNGSYIRFKNIISGQENNTDNYAITPSMEITVRLLGDSLEFNLNGSYGYNNAVSSLNNTQTPFTTQNYGANVQWRVIGGWRFSLEGEYTRNSLPGDGFFNTDFFILNAEVSKRFLSTQNLEIALIGNDILNQNINARREVNGNIITDNRTTIISRYFLLKATLRFNNRKTKEEDFNGWH